MGDVDSIKTCCPYRDRQYIFSHGNYRVDGQTYKIKRMLRTMEHVVHHDRSKDLSTRC